MSQLPSTWPRTGWTLTLLAGLFFLVDGVLRMAGFAPYVDGTVQAGYAVEQAPWIGAALVASTILYLWPRTAVLGAILVTAYLGGAVATHVRLEQPIWFAVAFAVMAWAGLAARVPEVRRWLLSW